MSARSAMRPALDKARGVFGRPSVDWRDTSITRVVRTYTGARVGLGTMTRTDTAILCDGHNPLVEKISPREVVASGGKYQAGDLRVTVTPEYDGGGISRSTLQPDTSAAPTEVYWLVTGEQYPSPGIVCEKIAEDHDELRITFTLRKVSVRL